ncbi:MAG: hypothetical protein P9L94_01700 [Candidatus Hinthialibacter antarcticus]|nr:hypothetical protein [Candidatus Hinthialibacter antarcticus]
MKAFKLIGMLAVVALVSFSAFAADDMPKIYTEDFEDGNADGWEFTDSSAWRVEDDSGSKVLCQFKMSEYEPPVRSPHNIAWIKDLYVSDCVIDVRLKSTGRNYGHRDMCVFFNEQDSSHFYYVHMAPAPPTDPNANKIMIVNGEPRKNICTKTNPGLQWKDDTYHHIRVVRDTESGSIKVYFDDMENTVLEAKDDTLKAGRIGFGNFDDTGCIDNISIKGVKVEKSAVK